MSQMVFIRNGQLLFNLLDFHKVRKATLFATHEEAVRTDVERAFGVLQARFQIINNPTLVLNKEKK